MSNRTRDSKYAHLEWPREWGKERPAVAFVLGFIFFPLLALVSVPMTIDWARNGGVLEEILGIAIGISALTFAIIVVPHMRVRRTKFPSRVSVAPEADMQLPGIKFPYALLWKWLVLLMMLVAAFTFSVRGILAMSEVGSGKYNSVRNGLGTGGVIFTFVLVVMIAAFLFYIFRSGNRPGSVVIGEYGVLQELGQTTRIIAWEDVAAVTPVVLNNSCIVRITPVSGRKIWVDTRRSLLDRWQRRYFEQTMDVAVWVLGVDPALFLHAVLFYWQNPAARKELWTERAIERMRNGELTPNNA